MPEKFEILTLINHVLCEQVNALNEKKASFDMRMLYQIYFAFLNMAFTDESYSQHLVNNTDVLESMQIAFDTINGLPSEFICTVAALTSKICKNCQLSNKNVSEILFYRPQTDFEL